MQQFHENTIVISSATALEGNPESKLLVFKAKSVQKLIPAIVNIGTAVHHCSDFPAANLILNLIKA